SFQHARVIVFDKASLYTRETSAYVAFDDMDRSDFTVRPAIVYDDAATTLPLIATREGARGTVRLFAIAGTAQAPTFTPGNIIAAATPLGWADAAGGNMAPQENTSLTIDVGDARMLSAVVRSGMLYAAHTIVLPATGPSRSAVQWWQIDPVTHGG